MKKLHVSERTGSLHISKEARHAFHYDKIAQSRIIKSYMETNL